MKYLDRLFHLTDHGTTVRQELLGALTSFFSVAYILFVTPSYLSLTGMDYTGVLLATCVSSALACFLSAALGLPFMLSPEWVSTLFFTYTLCLTMGYTWAQALAVVSISGVAYLVISLTPLRDQMISCIPPSMKNAISAGLGLFIALIGLLNSGIVQAQDGALLLGDMGDPATFLAILGLLITGVLMAWKVKGAILIGIVATTLLGFPLGVTQAPESMKLDLAALRPLLLSSVLFLSLASLKPDLTGLLALGPIPLISAVLSLVLSQHFDAVGTLMGVAGDTKLMDTTGDLEGQKGALLCCGAATCAGALLGVSNVTATGIREGARTGLSAVVTGLLFLVMIPFTPLAGMVTGAVLGVIV